MDDEPKTLRPGGVNELTEPYFMQSDLNRSFDSLFRAMYPKLYFYAHSLTGSDSDADDVVEEVFVDLWKRREEIDFGDRIEGFLFRAVYTRSINMLRRRNVGRARIESLNAINEKRMEMAATDSDDPVRSMENRDLRAMLDEAICELPDKCRQVFNMSYMSGMRNSEIAGKMGLSVRTVESHIFRALRYLRGRLGDMEKLLITIFLIFLRC